MDKTEFYPLFPDLLPPLAPDEREMLRENMRRDGLRHPIVRLQRPYGAIVDGWTRYEICQEIGIEPYFEVRDLTPGQAKRWRIQEHIGRRNLSLYQRGVLALQLKPELVAEAKERMGYGIPEGEAPLRVRDELAAVGDVSADAIFKTSVIEAKAPPYVKEDCANQTLTLNRGYRVTRALENAGPVTLNIAGKFRVDDPGLIEEVKRGEAAGADWVDELFLTGCVSVADVDETASIHEGSVAIMRAVNQRHEEHRRQAAQARYLDILIDKRSVSAFDYSVMATGQLTISLTAEEFRKFDSAQGKDVIVFVAVEA